MAKRNCLLTELSPEAEHIFDLMLRIPPDLRRVYTVLQVGGFSVDEINRLAIDFAYTCWGNEPTPARSVGDFYWDEPQLRPELHSAYLYRVVELLLDHGLEPNAAAGGEPLLGWLPYIENEYVGADTLALLFEHGADPDLKDGDGESLFLDLDFDISFAAQNQRDRRAFDAWVHSWLVYIGYGAKLEDGSLPVEVFEPGDDTDFDISCLRQHRNYTFGLSHIHSRGECWILHIFDKRTMWEVARM